MKIEPAILAKAKKVKLLLLDVDGVMTDGRIILGNNGEEFKAFHAQDGLGIAILQSAGVPVGIITKRQSVLVERRADELKIKYVYQGQKDKTVAFREILDQLKLTADQVAYMGDDLPDLSLLLRVGLSATVSDGVDYLKERVDWISQKKGGRGAVRELCELLMHAQGTYSLALDLLQNPK
jgi:3-deoxy-D-manno-octulosonate 8-phosphate phosphatase (KDO 8-P phosphatase)